MGQQEKAGQDDERLAWSQQAGRPIKPGQSSPVKSSLHQAIRKIKAKCSTIFFCTGAFFQQCVCVCCVFLFSIICFPISVISDETPTLVTVGRSNPSVGQELSKLSARLRLLERQGHLKGTLNIVRNVPSWIHDLYVSLHSGTLPEGSPRLGQASLCKELFLARKKTTFHSDPPMPGFVCSGEATNLWLMKKPWLVNAAEPDDETLERFEHSKLCWHHLGAFYSLGSLKCKLAFHLEGGTTVRRHFSDIRFRQHVATARFIITA